MRWIEFPLTAIFCLSVAHGAPGTLGFFEDYGDVGAVLHPGSVEYDAAGRSYTVAGSGENMWFAADALHYAWKKVSGDATLTVGIAFIGTGGNAHRKAVLMIRQSLDADSAYVDVALHGSGLTSLQARDEKGAATHEVQAAMAAPAKLRIVKHGETFYMWLAAAGEELHMAGGAMRVPFHDPFYVGIGVCAHDKDAVEKAVFSNVELSPTGRALQELYSTIETVPVPPGDRRVAYVTPGRIASPMWTRDGAALIFNRQGRLERVAAGGQPESIDMGSAIRPNNGLAISPDGQTLAFSGESGVYIVPAAGGRPQEVVEVPAARLHGWSPDGKLLAFSGVRDRRRDVYVISATGGRALPLTSSGALNDGPEFSPDGKHIYFHSDRSGSIQIWRMRADGSEPEQVTSGEFQNSFPHLSPDGTQMLFLSFAADASGVPEDKDVILRVMGLSDHKIRVLGKLVGGAGTIDAPSWSPDGKRVAFVSYQPAE